MSEQEFQDLKGRVEAMEGRFNAIVQACGGTERSDSRAPEMTSEVRHGLILLRGLVDMTGNSAMIESLSALEEMAGVEAG